LNTIRIAYYRRFIRCDVCARQSRKCQNRLNTKIRSLGNEHVQFLLALYKDHIFRINFTSSLAYLYRGADRLPVIVLLLWGNGLFTRTVTAAAAS